MKTEKAEVGGTAPDGAKLEDLAREAEADPTGEGGEAPAPAPASEGAPAAAPAVQGTGKKKGRPIGSKTRSHQAKPREAPAAPAPIIPLAALRAIIQAPYALAAAQYGAHWALTDAEADGMVPAHLAVAEEYLPAILQKHAALYTVAFLHLLTLFGKTQIHFRLKAEAERLARQEELETRGPDRPQGKGPAITMAPEGAEAFRSRVRPGPKEKPPGIQ